MLLTLSRVGLEISMGGLGMFLNAPLRNRKMGAPVSFRLEVVVEYPLEKFSINQNLRHWSASYLFLYA